jgi:hypothetical protein
MVEAGVCGFLVSVVVGDEVEVVGEGMAFARAILSRRSWRTALRCLRWSLSRRDTLEAALNWCWTKGGGEAQKEGRRMARRREVGNGPIAEDSVDVDIVGGAPEGRPLLQARLGWKAA